MTQDKQDLVDFLKERSILKVLDERVLGGICSLFQEISCGPGYVVFKQGDQADAIYIIRAGSVEVIQGDSPPKVIAYLTSGDCFGEMALLHDTTRNASIRVPEEAVILKLPRKAFHDLQNYFPEVTREVTAVINRRLSGKLPFNSPGLQGNLAFFDLPTVIQTVVGSRQVGVLSLRGRGGKLVAQVHFRSGKISHASFSHLTGEAAFYELLTRSEPLDFSFEQQRELDSSITIDKSLVSKEPHMLVIEGARRADELPGMMGSLDWPSNVFKQVARQPNWSAMDPEQANIGRKLWLLLEVGLSLQQMTEKIASDRYSVLSTIVEMLQLDMIAPVGARALETTSSKQTAPVPIAAIRSPASGRSRKPRRANGLTSITAAATTTVLGIRVPV